MQGPRQAVVVIHGMGEQRPMQFLRNFVDAAIPPDASRKGPYSKPDRMSGSYELRRFLAPAFKDHPQTELYEYYWAHHMKGNRLAHLLPLIKALLLHWPWNISRSLRGLWLIAWAIVVALAVAAWRFGAEVAFGKQQELLVNLGVSDWVATLIAALIGLALTWAVGSFGDVARYLNPDPQNVAIRQKIRSEAVSLLRNLHESGRYDRLTVVGHSLGSFVGLDALTYFWIETNQQYSVPAGPVNQEQLALLEDTGRCLVKIEDDLKSGSLTGEEKQEKRRELARKQDEYRKLQRTVWNEIRGHGNPWLVTDFVSVGSPLSHGAMLLESSKDRLREAQRRYELPRCPPEWEEKKGYAYPARSEEANDGTATLRTLHHAAPFACTRWTNIWFRSRGGILGDLFAGPVAPDFGPGVVDRPVTAGKLAMVVPILPHICYFKWTEPEESRDLTSAVGALREALDLDSWSWLYDLYLARELDAAETDEEKARIQKKIEARRQRANKAGSEPDGDPAVIDPEPPAG